MDKDLKIPVLILLVVVIVLLVIVAIAAASYLFKQAPSSIYAINLAIITLNSSYYSYFGLATTTTYAPTVSNFSTGQTFTEVVNLTNYGFSNLSVYSVALNNTGFTLLSVTPSLPYLLSSGSSSAFTLEIKPPSTSYHGTLNVRVEQNYLNDSNSSFSNYTFPNTTDIYGMNLIINYSNSSYTYFGPSSQFFANFSYYLNNDTAFTVPVNFTNNGTSTHYITSVNVPYFNVESVYPSLPYTLTPGASIGLSINLISPERNYTGPINVNVDAR